MRKHLLIAILLLTTTIKGGSTCCLLSLSPTSCMPDFCNLLYSALCNWWWPDSGTSTNREPAQLQHPKYDRSSGSWTSNCPCTKGCKYGVDVGDPDTCPQCLLGPGETCDNWNGECGSGLFCRFDGPMACSGECVSQHEFESRRLNDVCGEWDGKCDSGLKCKYDEGSSLLMPLYESLLHIAGACVTENAFHSQGEGEICNDLAGFCIDGLECKPSMIPFLPSTCMLPDKASDDGEAIIFPGAGGCGCEVALAVEEEGDDDVIFDIVDAVEHAAPDIFGQTDLETGEFEMIMIEELGSDASYFLDEQNTTQANNTWEDVTFELIADDGNMPLVSSDDFGGFDQLYEFDIVINLEDADGDEPGTTLEFDIISDEPISPEMLEGMLF